MTNGARSVTRLVAAVLVAASALPGLRAEAGDEAIRGRALDGETGNGLPAARVELLPQGLLTITSADGSWTFARAGAGPHDVRVTAVGFETTLVTVGEGEGVRDVVLPRRPYRLHESVTVTAGRREGRSFDVPRSMTVIDAEEFDRRMPRTTPEALADVPGLFLQKTNHGSGSPYLRGLVGNQVLVLVDGIRLNNATFRYGPSQYLAAVDPALIERIEVLRGSGSVLYGSDAMGGVINIVTRRPSGVGQPAAIRGDASMKLVTGGMEQAGRFGVQATGPKGGLQAGISLRRFGDLRAGGDLGVEAPSGYREAAADVRAEFPWSRQRLTFSYQHHRQDDVPRYDQVAQRGFASYMFDPQVRQLAFVQFERWSASPWLQRVAATASLHRSAEERRFQRRGSPVATGERDVVNAAAAAIEIHSQPRPSLFLVSGVALQRDDVASGRRDYDERTGVGEDRRGLYPDGARASSAALFTHASLTRPRVGVEGGLRVSRFDVRAPDPAFGSAHLAPVTATGSAGFTVMPVEGVRLFGSISQAFRAPNIDDLSSLGLFDFGIEVPSANLEPESSITAEGGVKVRTRLGAGSASVYRMSLNRLIDRVEGSLNGSQFVGDQRVYQKTNVGSAFVRGVELDGEHGLGPSLLLSGFLTYTFGEVASTGEPMRRIPPLNGQVAVRVLPSPFWVEGAVRFAAAQRRLAPGDTADHRIAPGGTPGWTVVNLSAGRGLGPQLEIVGGIQNLFDEAYRTHGSGIDGYGRSAWVGVSVGRR